MKKRLLFLLLSAVAGMCVAQSLTGAELLNRAIEYHDPSGQWTRFQGTLEISQDRPNGSSRIAMFAADLTNGYYKIYRKSDSGETTFVLEGDKCDIVWNGKTEFTSKEIEENRLTCERAEMMRNYYIYLYGLPMKLKDQGTIVHEKVQEKTFKGKQYNVLKVTYEEAVGNDIWYFYFDQGTHAMEVYQFYHNEADNDGEYVLLEGEVIYDKMRLPKDRTWYMNNDDSLLGTDKLLGIAKLKK